MKDNEYTENTKLILKEKRKKYHKNYYQKNRKKLLNRQKQYEKLRRKKLECIKPILNKLCKGMIPTNKGFKGFHKKTGKFIVYFN